MHECFLLLSNRVSPRTPAAAAARDARKRERERVRERRMITSSFMWREISLCSNRLVSEANDPQELMLIYTLLDLFLERRECLLSRDCCIACRDTNPDAGSRREAAILVCSDAKAKRKRMYSLKWCFACCMDLCVCARVHVLMRFSSTSLSPMMRGSD